MKNQRVKNYQAVSTLGKSGPELVVMVYNGAIDSLDRAAEFYKNNKIQDGYESIEKAKRFIVHLYTTLDEKNGGEVAANLSRIYAFLTERMNFIQATGDLTAINDATEILRNIREGWMRLVEQVKAKPDVKSASTKASQQTGNLSYSV